MFRLGGGLDVRVKEIPTPVHYRRSKLPRHAAHRAQLPRVTAWDRGPLQGQKSLLHTGKGRRVEVNSPQGWH